MPRNRKKLNTKQIPIPHITAPIIPVGSGSGTWLVSYRQLAEAAFGGGAYRPNNAITKPIPSGTTTLGTQSYITQTHIISHRTGVPTNLAVEIVHF